MKKIWTVNGTSGEYEDKYEWPVASFKEEENAIEWCNCVNKIMESFQVDQNNFKGLSLEDRQYLEKEFSKFDKSCTISYTGVFYYITVTELNPPLPIL